VQGNENQVNLTPDLELPPRRLLVCHRPPGWLVTLADACAWSRMPRIRCRWQFSKDNAKHRTSAGCFTRIGILLITVRIATVQANFELLITMLIATIQANSDTTCQERRYSNGRALNMVHFGLCDIANIGVPPSIWVTRHCDRVPPSSYTQLEGSTQLGGSSQLQVSTRRFVPNRR
jgi:hypothetical protein